MSTPEKPRGLPRRQWMPREEGTELVERLQRAGVPVMGWWHMEQGGPFLFRQRVPEGMQGEHAVPLVPAADLLEALGLTWEDVGNLRDAAGLARLDFEEHAYGPGVRKAEAEMEAYVSALADLADRLAALLPPPEGG